MSEQQLLRDPAIEPTEEVLEEALGKAYRAYVQFIEGLQAHDIHVDWRYYKDGKAWLGKAVYQWTTTRGTLKEMTACWLSIWDGLFKVSVFIPEKARAEAMQLPLSDDIKKMIEGSDQIGKLKFFPVIFELCSDELFDMIYILIDFKKKIK